MRTVHLTDTWLPRRDGVVTSVRTLTAALAAAGTPATTVVPRHPGQEETPGVLRLPALPCGVADLRMSPWPLLGRWAAGPLEQLRALDADVIHVHTPGPVGLLGVLAAQTLRLPLVQTYHTDLHAYADAYRLPGVALAALNRLYAHRLGSPHPVSALPHPVSAVPLTLPPTLPPTLAPPAGPGRRRHMLRPARLMRPTRQAWHRLTAGTDRRASLDATNTLLMGDAEALVVPTRAVLERLALPVPAERTVVIPTGVAPRPAGPGEAAAFRTRHGIAASERVVLYVGRVNAEKGVDRLLDAYALLAARVPDVTLVLVGAVYERKRIQARLEGMPGRVVLAGQQPSGTVAAAYAAADAFAFPSLTDTQALVLQEAALAGVPIVMADADLHRYGPLAGAAVLAGPEPGSLARELEAVLADKPVALCAAAARNAARHTPQAYAASMLELYHRVANTPVLAQAG